MEKLPLWGLWWDEKIYVLESTYSIICDGSLKYTKAHEFIEVYDPVVDKWTVLPMSKNIHWVGNTKMDAELVILKHGILSLNINRSNRLYKIPTCNL